MAPYIKYGDWPMVGGSIWPFIKWIATAPVDLLAARHYMMAPNCHFIFPLPWPVSRRKVKVRMP